MIRHLIYSFCFLLACVPTSTLHDELYQYDNSILKDADTVLIIEHTGCYGTCPVERRTVFMDGNVIIENRKFVKPIGRRNIRINSERAKQIFKSFFDSDFLNLKDSYMRWSVDCADSRSDDFTTIFTLKLGSKLKSIKYYHGCGGFSAENLLIFLDRSTFEATKPETIP